MRGPALRIEAATPADVYAVATRMRAHDVEELSAVLPYDPVPDIALHMANTYGSRDDVKVVWSGRERVAVIGDIMCRPGSLALLMFATDKLPQVGLSLTRFLKREWLPRLPAAGVHRVEAASLAGYDDMHRWLEMIGLRREGVMRRFGKRGEDFVRFAWVAP